MRVTSELELLGRSQRGEITLRVELVARAVGSFGSGMNFDQIWLTMGFSPSAARIAGSAGAYGGLISHAGDRNRPRIQVVRHILSRAVRQLDHARAHQRGGHWAFKGSIVGKAIAFEVGEEIGSAAPESRR